MMAYSQILVFFQAHERKTAGTGRLVDVTGTSHSGPHQHKVIDVLILGIGLPKKFHHHLFSSFFKLNAIHFFKYTAEQRLLFFNPRCQKVRKKHLKVIKKNRKIHPDGHPCFGNNVYEKVYKFCAET